MARPSMQIKNEGHRCRALMKKPRFYRIDSSEVHPASISCQWFGQRLQDRLGEGRRRHGGRYHSSGRHLEAETKEMRRPAGRLSDPFRSFPAVPARRVARFGITTLTSNRPPTASMYLRMLLSFTSDRCSRRDRLAWVTPMRWATCSWVRPAASRTCWSRRELIFLRAPSAMAVRSAAGSFLL